MTLAETPDLFEIIPRLPTRYEDLNEDFRGSLRPNEDLIALVNKSFKSIKMTGGVRFLPIFGMSGSGKSCATLELATHLPEIEVIKLDQEVVSDPDLIVHSIRAAKISSQSTPLVAVVDQYEEAAVGKEGIPTQFVEKLAMLDVAYRDRPVLFIWLTTSEDFRDRLVSATSRRSRILTESNFVIKGPERCEWPSIVAQTFSAHNSGRELADFEVLESTIEEISDHESTIGQAIEKVARRLENHTPDLQDLADYQVVMLWPVTDGQRIQTINTFASPRQGYRISWHAFYNQLNAADKSQLPLDGLNKARLYFDLRLVPIAAADLHGICGDFTQDIDAVIQSYISRFGATHFMQVATGQAGDSFSPLRERRDSKRATAALDWYKGATKHPTQIGKMIAGAAKRLGFKAMYESTETSRYSNVRADVKIERDFRPRKVLVELKAYSPEHTRPSDVASQIRITLTRHARFAGFIERQ